MTRINVIPPEELCDQHLLAEHREIVRIPNMLRAGLLCDSYVDAPAHYVLGEGHVKFFVSKLAYLCERYVALHQECRYRGFNVTDMVTAFPLVCEGEYVPTAGAIAINQARILDNMPAAARWSHRFAPDWVQVAINTFGA